MATIKYLQTVQSVSARVVVCSLTVRPDGNVLPDSELQGLRHPGICQGQPPLSRRVQVHSSGQKSRGFF